MKSSGVIYRFIASQRRKKVVLVRPTFFAGGWRAKIGWTLLALALGGITGPLIPNIRLESTYYLNRTKEALTLKVNPPKPLPRSVPMVFNPLVTPDGGSISPVNTDFSLIIPKIGVNAPVIPAVNPASPGEYAQALLKGVAHASTSYLPNEDGTVYLFSHSTSYDWFVKDLNAVFYLLKNLEEGDLVVIFYEQRRYTYVLREKRIVAPTEVSYLVGQSGKRQLILQTCWPPGSTAERLLLFADLVEEYNETI